MKVSVRRPVLRRVRWSSRSCGVDPDGDLGGRRGAAAARELPPEAVRAGDREAVRVAGRAAPSSCAVPLDVAVLRDGELPRVRVEREVRAGAAAVAQPQPESAPSAPQPAVRVGLVGQRAGRPGAGLLDRHGCSAGGCGGQRPLNAGIAPGCSTSGLPARRAGSRRPTVRSPVTLRRQALMLGSSHARPRSRKRITEVWSKTSEQT